MRQKRILIIRIDGIGDLLCVTPTLKAVRQTYPEARIDFLANLGPHIVLDGNPDIDQPLIDYRSKVSGSRLKGLRFLPKRFTAWLQRKLLGYDLVIVAHYGMHDRAMAIARSAKSPRILVNIEPEYQTRISDPRIALAHYQPNMHEVEGVFACIRPLISDKPAGRMWVFPQLFRLRYPDAWETQATELVLGINLSASVQERHWPTSHFVTLSQTLAALYPNASIAITGLPDDVKRYQQLTLEAGHATDRLFYFSTPSLEAYIAAISVCSLYIGIEGGGVHLASALAVPQVALFQRPKITRWHPWSVPYAIVTSNTDIDAIHQITTDQVLLATKTLLKDLGY